MNSTRKRVAVLISGRGSNMISLVEAARDAKYPAEIVTVISNRPEAPGLKWAADNKIPTAVFDHKKYRSREAFESELQKAVTVANADLIALAGFMRLMTPQFVERWRDRMINIHPSLLPSFKGLHTHESALEAGVKITGCTVHFVRSEMDVGPIIGQAAVPVLSGDTPVSLAKRVLDAEHKLYPWALALVASGRIRIRDEKVVISEPVNQPSALFAPALPG
jgi:phosphoribosylglycinamide formyltransferase 1